MAQGDEKTRQKGKKMIFVMSHDKIKIEIVRRNLNKVVTYARTVVDF